MLPDIAAFDRFFWQELYPELDELEARRQSLYTSYCTARLLCYGLLGLAWLALGLLLLQEATQLLLHQATHVPVSLVNRYVMAFWVAGGLSGVLLGMLALFKSYLGEQIKWQFKELLIAPMVRFLSPDLAYWPNQVMPQLDFSASQLFRQEPDSYSGDDYIEGKLGAVDIRLSEVKATAWLRSSNRDRRKKKCLFWGILLRLEEPVRLSGAGIKGRYFILPDQLHRFGVMAEGLHVFNPTGETRVSMDHPEFERYFAVYGSDPIEAHTLLSHTLMDALVQFRQATGVDVSLSWVYGVLTIAIHYRRPMFEHPIDKPVNDPDALFPLFEEMHLLLRLASDLSAKPLAGVY